MKKVYALFVFFIAISTQIFSQTNNINKLISGKWDIKSIAIADDFMKVAGEGHWISFEPNGKYKLMLDNEGEVGTWSMENETLNFDEGVFDGETKIEKLSDSELVFNISGYTLALTKGTKVNDVDQDFTKLTSGKWSINSVSIEDETMTVDSNINWMKFHSDGFYNIMLDEEEQLGTWSVDENNQIKLDKDLFDGDSSLEIVNDSELKVMISGYTIALTK